MNEITHVNKFYEQLKSFNDDIIKHRAKTISTRQFRTKAEKAYEKWKMEVHPILRQSGILNDKSLSPLDSVFERFYSESTKRVSDVKMLRTLLEEIVNGYFADVIIPLRTKKPLIEPNLLDLLDRISDEDEREYMKEALKCVSIEAKRAAIVVGWIAAMWSLHKKIELKSFSLFNKFYKKRHARNAQKKIKTVKKIEDFEYYPDSEVLLVSEDIGILDRGEKRILEKCLELRNICAHPSKYEPEHSEVSVFFERIVNVLLSK